MANDGDAITGRGLAGNGQTARTSNNAVQRDRSTDIEHHEASAVAHRIAKRTRAAVRQRCNVINRAAEACARGVRTKAERAGKREDVGLKRADDQIHLPGRVGVNRS